MELRKINHNSLFEFLNNFPQFRIFEKVDGFKLLLRFTDDGGVYGLDKELNLYNKHTKPLFNRNNHIHQAVRKFIDENKKKLREFAINKTMGSNDTYIDVIYSGTDNYVEYDTQYTIVLTPSNKFDAEGFIEKYGNCEKSITVNDVPYSDDGETIKFKNEVQTWKYILSNEIKNDINLNDIFIDYCKWAYGMPDTSRFSRIQSFTYNPNKKYKIVDENPGYYTEINKAKHLYMDLKEKYKKEYDLFIKDRVLPNFDTLLKSKSKFNNDEVYGIKLVSDKYSFEITNREYLKKTRGKVQKTENKIHKEVTGPLFKTLDKEVGTWGWYGNKGKTDADIPELVLHHFIINSEENLKNIEIDPKLNETVKNNMLLLKAELNTIIDQLNSLIVDKDYEEIRKILRKV